MVAKDFRMLHKATICDILKSMLLYVIDIVFGVVCWWLLGSCCMFAKVLNKLLCKCYVVARALWVLLHFKSCCYSM